jgi:peptidoglycan/LPS O-acetylase OafA/YrhL
MERRNDALDFLRGIAVSAVLVCHLSFLSGAEYLSPFMKRLVHFLGYGWMGVDLFFVLSGFLISGLLFREQIQHGRIRLRRFYIRRGFKIYPPFYLLLATTILYFLVRGERLPWAPLISEACFVQNYLGFIEAHQHTWSLAIEEHFYFALPILLVWLARVSNKSNDPFRRIPLVFAVLAIAVIGARLLTMRHDTPTYFHTYVYTHCRIDSLMCGVLLSYYWHYHKNTLVSFIDRHLGLIIAVPPLCFALATLPRSQWWISFAGYSLLWLAMGCILLAICCSSRVKFSAVGLLRPITRIGKYSYSIYLWHFPILFGVNSQFMNEHFQFGFLTEAIIYIGTSLAVGIALSKALEFPTLRLRDRLFPSFSAMVAGSAVP